MDNLEDHIHSIKTEWNALKEKWFHGEKMDPVFEGVVRDFCAFDDAIHNIHAKVGRFMQGVEQLAQGMTVLSEGVSAGLAHTADSHIASDSCKLKEATNQIARSDAPHSAIAKLRRDMHFNILTPVQSHISNNRNLKVSLDVRRRRLIELNSAKKQFDDCVKKNLDKTDRRLLQAQSAFESAKMSFSDVDRHVFEWLYILEEYRGDILDSTLQTLKYLQYEFFATSAHAISSSLPMRMEFRPMVEMTPEHLEAQVEMELQESEELGEETVADFATRLIDKKAREDSKNGDVCTSMPVDPLSLSSLLSQGFEEGPARRALRLHQNNTQDALDWLINGGQAEDGERKKQHADSVRMPTTVKRVQKLKAMRKAQAEKAQRRERDRGEAGTAEGSAEAASSSNGATGARGSRDKEGGAGSTSRDDDDEDSPRERKPRKSESRSEEKREARRREPQDMLSGEDMDGSSSQKKPAKPSAGFDLLSLDEEPPPPTDFSKQMDVQPLPPQLSFDTSRPSGISSARATGGGGLEGLDLDDGSGQAAASSTGGLPAGLSPDLAATVQALAAQSNVTAEELIRAAQQLQGAARAGQASSASSSSAWGQMGNAGYPSPPQSSSMNSPGVMPAAAPAMHGSPGSGFAALDPLGGSGSGAQPAPKSPEMTRQNSPPSTAATADKFGDLVNLTSSSANGS
mmetsp:Transcript_60789/g.131867  ORF Transcript_60789/g.131867 Transcript_60789/m.131867 type:complete len:685 (-) Transcript_60789:123-2177(-)|eukprot:CAMPEP_0170614698 /NCGR_PEP_ID=MMETSP0224-20130122/24942_1 /TAXON_ID=285029 /ORGANISM="Togula jolla, Strain CCCM 725" /LENGTH=684 /DNA_ID=CAMNT_0010940379 /DNA_START=39 /DNA_END=2093 /DNA_ORIENTATION=+